MSLFLGVLSAAVALDDSDYKKKLKGLEESSEDSFSRIAAAAGRYLTAAAILNFGRQAIQTFSDLEEATNKFNVVFQGFSKQAGDAVDELREKFGQSELSAKQMLSGTGDILTGFGFDRKLALDMSVLTAQLGADLASFTNYAGGAAGATDALTKAMLGETESAKMLGIVIKQDSEEYKNLVEQAMTTGVQIKEGGEKIVVTNEQQAKAVAALALAYQQSKNAHGDFLRSQDSIANQTQILKNNMTELYAVIGKDSASAYSQALQGANALLKWYTNLSPATRTMTNNTTLLTTALILLGKKGYLASANAAVKAAVANLTFAGSTKAAAAGTGIMTVTVHGLAAAFHSLNVAMGPVGWTILAIAAAYTTWTAIVAAHEGALQDAVDAATEAYEVEKQKTDVLKAQHDEEMTKLQRLEELAKYEQLNTDEKKEANKIAKELNKNYTGLGITIDSMTGKLHVNENAWKSMTQQQAEAQKKQMHQELKALEKRIQAVKKETRYRFLDGVFGSGDMIGDSNISWQQAAIDIQYGSMERLKEIKSVLQSSNDDSDATAALEHLIKLKEEELRLKKSIEQIEESGTKNAEERRKKQAELERARLAAQKKSLDELTEYEWQIVFDESDFDKQLKMLRAKAEKIFANSKNVHFSSIDRLLAANASRLSEEELKLRKQILEIRQQEKRIVDQQKKAEDDKAKQEKKRAEEAKKRNEKERAELIKSSSKEEWDNLFNRSGFDVQLKMLDKRIYDITSRLSNQDYASLDTIKYGDINKLTTEQIRLRKQLLDLEKQRNEVIDKRREAEKKELERIRDVSERYNEFWKKRADAKRDDRIMKSVETLMGQGRVKEARKLALAEMEYYRQAAKQADEQYRSIPIANASNKKDWQRLAAEKELNFNTMQANLEQYDRWKDVLKRLQPPDADGELDKRHDRARETIGAWSLAALSRMTADSPEVQTARNTKETSRKMTELLELEKQRETANVLTW